MPGTPVDDSFDIMDHQEKKQIFAQMAKLLKALQDYQLPESITDFGGVTFDDTGRIVSTAMTSVGIRSWPSYEASFKGRLEVALKADANPHIQGWRANGVRECLDAFAEHGISAQYESRSSKKDRVIVHADFSEWYIELISGLYSRSPGLLFCHHAAANNLLFDAMSFCITALLDYDFACVLHPSYEFLRSFDGAGGQLRG